MTRLRGLYAITSQSICASASSLSAAVEQALVGGARLIQYRDKDNEPATRARHARMLLELCRSRGVALIINDHVDLAHEIGADGVHVGQADRAVPDARRQLGAASIIGVSCGNSVEKALAAAEQGASYVALGRFFASRTKPDAPPADLATLRAARGRLRMPICAIGGIRPDHVTPLLAAGADLIAAIDGVFGATDIRSAAAAYASRFR